MKTARTLLYLLTAVPLGALGLAVLVAGWTVVPVLAITPLVVPALDADENAKPVTDRANGSLGDSHLGATATLHARDHWTRLPRGGRC